MPQVLFSDLGQSPNAEAQTNRIKSLLRTSGSGNDVVHGMPTSDFGIGNNGVTGIPTSDFGIDNIVDTQVIKISDEMDTTAPADTDIDEQVARAKSLADYELRQAEIRNQQVIEGVRQEAVSALLQQEQTYTQQRAQDHAQVAAKVQRIEHQAQGFIYEAQGATYEVPGARQKERQERERERMTAEKEKAKQKEKKTKRARKRANS